MVKSVSFRRLPGGNPLFHDYIEQFEHLRPFFRIDYRQPIPSWATVQDAHRPVHPELIEGLLEDAERWGCHKRTFRNIEALRQPETIVVVTGQQTGLFGGPLFTYYKALSTVLWAKEIQNATGRTTVPIFWMETSDHDFYEVNHIHLLDVEGNEVTLSLTHSPELKRRIVGGIRLNGEIEQLTKRLFMLLPTNAYRGPYIEMLSSHYRPGETIGSAFAKLFCCLFSEEGLIVFDAENARCKKAVAPLLDRILTSSEKLNDTLKKSTQAVHQAGYPPQIQPLDGRMQLFARQGDVRVPLSVEGNLLPDDEPPIPVGMPELRRQASEHPENFLPKVSLRPIMQDFLFSTAAYVAGPAEIAYFAQLKPLYEFLNVPMPVIIPRLSITLIEGKIQKVLEKYNFTPEDFRRGAKTLVNEQVESDTSSDLVGLFARIRQKWEDMQHELTIGLLAIDPTLQHPVEKTLERWRQGLEVLEEKARVALQRKNETMVTQIKKCCTHLAPGGNLQERRYSLQYYLARYGKSLNPRIRNQTQLDLFRHQLVYLMEDE
ncbi:MAG: bacillithiol biosynthesis cysteine-adding enzyme BshC [bacterium]